MTTPNEQPLHNNIPSETIRLSDNNDKHMAETPTTFSNQLTHSSIIFPFMYGHDKWPLKVENAFMEALQLIVKNGTSKIKIRNKNYGRNELISLYIKHHTGEVRTKKQISSHIQVWKKSILNKISGEMELTPLDKQILALIEKGPKQSDVNVTNFFSTFEAIIENENNNIFNHSVTNNAGIEPLKSNQVSQQKQIFYNQVGTLQSNFPTRENPVYGYVPVAGTNNTKESLPVPYPPTVTPLLNGHYSEPNWPPIPTNRNGNFQYLGNASEAAVTNRTSWPNNNISKPCNDSWSAGFVRATGPDNSYSQNHSQNNHNLQPVLPSVHHPYFRTPANISSSVLPPLSSSASLAEPPKMYIPLRTYSQPNNEMIAPSFAASNGNPITQGPLPLHADHQQFSRLPNASSSQLTNLPISLSRNVPNNDPNQPVMIPTFTEYSQLARPHITSARRNTVDLNNNTGREKPNGSHLDRGLFPLGDAQEHKN
ncbi:uncharacterized protein NDAI_0A05480 [Naumovozyma dairenensis CBS 421]|uniref:TEA domain-containing protein n=1 Tax=Naumovozyma dairenensis (strain ATCC 10597 / BCRC 20456 / CBS 421 / NBRC 0211 / NRRL Y-12639) TaxID=1071378 RepID=G0W4G5_NAUDC|nr:hypothetical protein NDAI_0A05480 [Naumovozyma dairenensis CBS 421]CCD22703.1 hypothetical protein NDAI_0A05480 [Naumovozyma dairenensis CBS 421]